MKTTEIAGLAVLLLLTLLPAWVLAADLVASTSFSGKNSVAVTFTAPVDKAVAGDVTRYTIYEENDPDIKLHLTAAAVDGDGRKVTLTFTEPLNTAQTHVISLRGAAGGKDASFKVAKSYLGYLFSIFIAALLINNYVFTKYLGLCVFFGTSKRKSTAKGMGVVFTIVMLVSASMSWLFYKFVLIPFNLNFLQIVVFIGLVSLTVQAVDTILRKVNPVLFNSFGVYLVLVIANCIIIAVPLVMSSLNYSFFETFMLALGAGGGFLLALYLMSSVRERLEIANIPPTFKGLPIAFIVAGQFAMAFLGFSGLQLF